MRNVLCQNDPEDVKCQQDVGIKGCCNSVIRKVVACTANNLFSVRVKCARNYIIVRKHLFKYIGCILVF